MYMLRLARKWRCCVMLELLRSHGLIHLPSRTFQEARINLAALGSERHSGRMLLSLGLCGHYITSVRLLSFN